MATRWNAKSFVLLLAVMVLMVPVQTAWGYDGNVHMSITSYAGQQFAKYYPNSEPLQFINEICYGAWEEDEVDLVFGYPVGDQPSWHKTIPHFWDADGGPLDPVTVYGTGLEEWPNAWQKISFMGVVEADYHTIWPHNGLWQQALYYSRLYELTLDPGNRKYAYGLLGHIAHLIQDMSVPAHVHEDAHPTYDSYEDTMNLAWNDSKLDKTELNKGLINYSNHLIPGWDPSLSAIYYLLYTTNQRADFFGSEGEPGNTGYAAGDILDPMAWIDPSYWPSDLLYYCTPGNMFNDFWRCDVCGTIWCYGNTCGQVCPICRGHVSQQSAPKWIANHYTLVYAVRATATLFEIFMNEITPKTSIGFTDRYTVAGQVYVAPDTRFTLAAVDDTAVLFTKYRITGRGYDGVWKVYSAPFTFNQVQPGLSDGEYTIQYYSKDYGDHEETVKTVEVSLTTHPADYRVSVSTGGSYLGIQVAIDAAPPRGSVIKVKPGTFRECINFKGKAIVLQSTGGPEVTIIDGTGGLHVVSFVTAEGNGSILDGFTITGGNANGDIFPNDSGGGFSVIGLSQRSAIVSSEAIWPRIAAAGSVCGRYLLFFRAA